MRKLFLFVLIGVLSCGLAYAEKPTRLYTPITKQATYDTNQTNKTIWTPITHESIVWDSFVVSTNSASQSVTFAASDTIIVLNVAASRPVVSPGNWLWKKTGETIRVTTLGNIESGTVNITLQGWEESN